MKKLLLGIFWFFFWLCSFCSALTIQDPEFCVLYTWNIDWPDSVTFQDWNVSQAWSYVLAWDYDLTNWYPDMAVLTQYWWEFTLDFYEESYYYYAMMLFPSEWCSQSWWWSSFSEINVYYNNWSSTSILCDWENSIAINWLSTLYWTSTFIPFFNISYVDENNQKLIESYDKEILYLDPWQFKKTYTWNNDWILSIQNQCWSSSDIIFTWETLPVILTWSTWSVFSNFWDNALLLITSNIPWIITVLFILWLIIFLFKLLTPKRKR